MQTKQFATFCDTYGAKIHHTPPLYAQADGLVERVNRGIKKRLQITKLTPTFGPEVYVVVSAKGGDCIIKSEEDGTERRRHVNFLKKPPTPLQDQEIPSHAPHHLSFQQQHRQQPSNEQPAAHSVDDHRASVSRSPPRVQQQKT